ncbi:hypothetical protein LOK49_LG10G01962 [Camellia lanceoleosa]|uniref:Uncharacterized protein n=1 Tax=Camellia lanceoleosa TaxID=1840588 RepID=A0ACC0G812_9ERIC|nr:hypothetical protein LOK49_LG10G01962 [Camellia lanceoleosa]
MYRCEAMWPRHDSCEKVVADNWRPSTTADVRSLVSNIAHVSSSLRRWDRNVFGCVKHQLKEKTELLLLNTLLMPMVQRMAKLRCDIDEILERNLFFGANVSD